MTTSQESPTTPARVAQLKEVLAGLDSLLVVVQDYPDPDALASAAALSTFASHLGVGKIATASAGAVGRAENRALLAYLGLPWRQLDEVDTDAFDCVAMVDTQPHTGNNSLPHEVDVDIVVDHHPIREATKRARFYDVRQHVGATSTILFEYLRAAGVAFDTRLATALVYGIRSDTHDLGRDATQADIEAITELYPLANHRMLSEIQASKTPRSYFAMLATALVRARVYGECVVSEMGPVDIPDIVGEVADLLLRDEGCTWSLCFGVCNSQVLLSLRTDDRQRDAGEVMRTVVAGIGTGGGHRAMGGGQIALPAGAATIAPELTTRIVGRLLQAIGIGDTEGAALVAGQADQTGL